MLNLMPFFVVEIMNLVTKAESLDANHTIKGDIYEKFDDFGLSMYGKNNVKSH